MSSIGKSGLTIAVASLLLPAITGCGGSSGTGSTPAIPNLVGTYTGTWTQDLSVDNQPAGTLTCACTFTVPSQTENAFYGRSSLSSPCDQGLAAGQGRGGTLAISEGRVETNGAVSFRFSEDVPVGLSAGGCTVTAMPAFSGSLSGGTLSASRTEAYDCTAADGHRYSLTIRLQAARG